MQLRSATRRAEVATAVQPQPQLTILPRQRQSLPPSASPTSTFVDFPAASTSKFLDPPPSEYSPFDSTLEQKGVGKMDPTSEYNLFYGPLTPLPISPQELTIPLPSDSDEACGMADEYQDPSGVRKARPSLASLVGSETHRVMHVDDDDFEKVYAPSGADASSHEGKTMLENRLWDLGTEIGDDDPMDVDQHHVARRSLVPEDTVIIDHTEESERWCISQTERAYPKEWADRMAKAKKSKGRLRAHRTEKAIF